MGVDCSGGKKAIVIFVPVPQLKQFQKIQTRLVRELEKKFSGKHVVFIAQRRILAKPTRKANKLKQKRPRSRTLLAVHNSILDDLVYPAEIVGKRIRVRLDGSRVFKIHLDKAQQTNIEHKTDTYQALQKADGQGSHLRIPRALPVNWFPAPASVVDNCKRRKAKGRQKLQTSFEFLYTV